jgi:protein O-GlcNAc transferase
MNTNARPSHKAVRKGLAHLEAGRIDTAERLFRSVLQSEPGHPEANHALGALAVRQGKPQSALAFLTAALKADPQRGQHWLSFAEALLLTGQAGDARAVFELAVARGFSSPDMAALKPRIDRANIYWNALKVQREGRSAEAERLYTTVLPADPDHVESSGMIDQLIAAGVNVADAQANFGALLIDLGRPPEAIAQLTAALRQNPHHVHAHNNLSMLLNDLGKPVEAIVHATAALRQDPGLAEAHNNLANALVETNRLDEAVRHYREALRLKPDYAMAWNNLGNALKAQGKITEAIVNYRTALGLDPDFLLAHNNLIMTLGYSAEVPHEVLVDQARQFNDAVAAPLLRMRAFTNIPDPGRRLRVGYVSGDFRTHAVNYFFEPLLTHHRKDAFEFFAYANMPAGDLVTARLKQHFDHWRDICGLSDDAAADLIEADGIDILIDMSGHSSRNRILVFARKPAPIQATWLGFTTTTGVKAIDYRITDVYADPPGMTEHLNTETLWRLPATFCCYQARAGIADPIDHPPRDDNGFTTFGCFNNFTKVTDGALRCWAEILKRVTDARLLLEIPGIDGAEFRSETQARLAQLGLPLDRVILEPRKPSNQYVLYNKIDIALDPFPFNGGTTSLDALWMGVPVISLAGAYFTARMGVTIMNNMGLPELSAADEKAYVDLATDLATDPSKLRAIRHNLRQKMSDSPIMDYPAFARDMEAAYRGMWQAWCANQPARV